MANLPTDIDHLVMQLEVEALDALAEFWCGGPDKLATAAHESLRVRCDLTGESYPEVFQAAHEEAKRLAKERYSNVKS